MMRDSLSFFAAAVAVAIVSALFFATPLQAGASDDEVTISGLVRTAQFGAGGETIRVYIDAAEEPILVSRREKGKELLTQVGATVRASGYVRKIRTDEGFTRTIDIMEYVVEAPATPKPRKTN